ncbi:MAG TPA: response regulator [Desulfuromonadales bacterium]|nr:response regulator [Desulfuromonadales bacterium]
MSRTVMIVDDALFMRKILGGIVTENGYTIVAEASSGIEAMKYLRTLQPDIILLDIILPDSNGLELLESIIQTSPQSKVVICSGIGQEQVVQKSRDLGAHAFIPKPISPENVLEALESLVW